MKKFTYSVWRQSIVFILFILLSGKQVFAQQDTIEKYYATHTSATWCTNPDSLHNNYLLQHSPYINKFYPLIKKAYRNNDIDSVCYAMVTDRLLSEKGRRQLYGSQCIRSTTTEKYFQDNYILWPVKDFKSVNERRKAMGFTNTVEENAKRLNAIIPPEYYEGKEKMKWVRRW